MSIVDRFLKFRMNQSDKNRIDEEEIHQHYSFDHPSKNSDYSYAEGLKQCLCRTFKKYYTCKINKKY